MAELLANNLGTVLVAIVFFGMVALIIYSMVRNKKKGKSSCSCGCGCGSCPSSGICHSKK